MTIKYEVLSYKSQFRQEYEDFDEATKQAETFGRAEMITWKVNPNRPGCKPDLVYNSCAVRIWEKGAWRQIDIA